MTALHLTGITKTYPGGSPVLRGVELEVARGAITGLLGLNGSGKTTTIRILMGLASPDGGTVSLLGSPVDPVAGTHHALLGAVLDEPMYFDWLSGRDYLAFCGRVRGLSTRETLGRIDALLDYLDLEHARHQPIRTYSTGMKKKIALAAAILHHPPILVLDEPFEGIDPPAARDVREALQLLAAKGTAVLVTSHILDTVERLCTDIAVLHHGVIALRCAASELEARAAGLAQEGGSDLEKVFLELVASERRKTAPEFLR